MEPIARQQILTYFRLATPNKVEILFDALLPGQRDPWVVLNATSEAVLHIRIIQPSDVSPRPELHATLPFLPTCGVVIEIHPRHRGESEARSLLESLLTAFDGVAFDGFTNQPWLLDEIRQEARKAGHTFLDADGWWEAAHRRAIPSVPTPPSRGPLDESTVPNDPQHDTMQELRTLVDKWCERRELGALRIVLPVWPLGSGVLLTDDVAMLRDALRHLRAMGKSWLPPEEYDTVDRAVAALTRAIDRR